MFYILALLTLLLTAADHWTTYLCLRSPVGGWTVTEANPIADWLFQTLGLVPGLLFDSAVTLAAIGFLLTTDRIPKTAVALFFCVVTIWTGHAVANNFEALRLLGLSPFGSA